MDPKKWDNIGNEDDENDKRECIRELLAMKAAADEIFDSSGGSRGTCSCDQYAHYLDLYLRVLNTSSKLNTFPNSHDLQVSCELNCACCYMMMKNWDGCIETCEAMITRCPSELNSTQLIRCHYFRSYAYLHKNSGSTDRERAFESSSVIQDTIKSLSTPLCAEDIAEYSILHERTRSFREKDILSSHKCVRLMLLC